MAKNLVLASRSPARRQLMKKLGLPFMSCESGYRENMRAYSTAWRLAKYLARMKAVSVAKQYPDSTIIGADTFITCRGKKIGKPKSIAHAKRLIRFMSGQIIKVYTGVAIIETDHRANIIGESSDYALTDLWIKKMSGEEVGLLAHQKDALHISGAFSIEGEGGKMILRLRGDYDNVIGLPIFLLKKMLHQ